MSDVRAIEDLFGELIERESPAERRKFLDEICRDDETLRGQLEKLLEAHERAGSFLREDDAADPTATYQQDDLAGTTIGPYKLRERLGAGGMGVVWAAEQKQPLRRKVAVKVIKPGMDSEQVVARFEAERAALALMDHPHIARVLDAGTTEQGRPYFVMELIRGVPITEYCDAKRLTIRERLKLFIQVCKAVQHAHQKGVIHRDIKPSNVLVGEQDGQPVPKVIDFGVAKALHQPLTDRSFYSGLFQAIGTLAYMSPEQAGLSISDIDTRADVYGLGVLLYELLTGSTPFDQRELASAAFDEACRIIREKDPPKPSTRISTLGARATDVGRDRGTAPDGLGRLVRGDLDWIVTKALEKDRGRRYDTAEALAAELQRHLESEPVEARPPSTAYLVSRFYRRNRVGVNVAVGMMALLLLGIAGTATGWVLAIQRSQELAELADAFRTELITQAAEAAMMGRSKKAREYLASAKLDQRPYHRHWQHMIDGQIALNEGRIDDAITHFEKARRHSPESVAAISQLAHAALLNGDNDQWAGLLRELKALPAETPLERLYKAQALSFSNMDSEKLLDLIRGYFEERSSPAAHLARARVFEHLGVANADAERIEKGILDTVIARAEIPGSAFADWTAIDCYSTAIAFYRAQGNDDMVRQHTESARRVALQMDPNDRLGQAVAAKFFNRLGEIDRANACYERAIDLGARGYWLSDYALFLLERDLRTGDKLDLIRKESRDDGIERISLALLYADDPLERDVERRAIRDADHKLPRVIGVIAAAILRLLGEDQQVVADFLEKKTIPHPELGEDGSGEESAAVYLSGRLGDKDKGDLLAAARNDVGKLCIFHTLIGLSDLAVPENRPQAEKHLQQALEFGTNSWAEHYARAVLARLRDNPTWPQPPKTSTK